MSAHRCETAWKLPMGLPNWRRSRAQSTAIARAREPTPIESAATASTAWPYASRSAAGTSVPSASTSPAALLKVTAPMVPVRSSG